MDEPKKRYGISPVIETQEGYWIRIDGTSYPVSKVRSVTLSETPFESEAVGGESAIGWAFFAVAFPVIIGWWAGFFLISAIIGLIIAIPIFLVVSARNLKARRRQRENPLVDVSIALDDDDEPLEIASGVRKAEGIKIRDCIEKTIASAAANESFREEHPKPAEQGDAGKPDPAAS